MTEPESIMQPINESDKVVCISLELLEAYVALHRAAEYQLKMHREDTVDMLENAHLAIRKAGGYHE
jgi:hypothetical protein